MEERQREEDEEEGASPKGTLPSLKRREPHVGLQELGPLPGKSLQGHPQVSLTPPGGGEDSSGSTAWHSARGSPLPLPPGLSSSLLTLAITPYLVQAREEPR